MRVAAEITKSMLGSAEGPLGIDDPLFPKGLPQQLGEDLRSRQRLQGTVKSEFAR